MSQSDLDQEHSVLRLNLKGHKKPITGLSFHPDGQQFASGSEDNSMMIWNTRQSTRSYSFSGHSDTVTGVAYAPTGKLLASCSLDQTVRIWVPTLKGTNVEFRAHTAAVQAVAFSPDGKQLVTGARDKALKLWNVQHKRFLSSFVGHNNWIRRVEFSQQGDVLVSCGDDRSVRVWDARGGVCEHVFQTGKASPTSISIHHTGISVAVSMESGSLRIYDIRMKKLQQHYVLHDHTTNVCWHPNANYLLTSGRDGKIIVVDAMEGRPLYTMTGHRGAVSCVQFNKRGDTFATAGIDGHIMVWVTKFA